MKVLITGISGLVGQYWSQSLLKRNWELVGLSRSGTFAGKKPKNLTLYPCDILNPSELEPILKKHQPNWILHLAAQSFNSISWSQEDLTHRINYLGTMNLLQAIRRHCAKAKVLIAGTSVSYGVVAPDQCPIPESHPLKPSTPYGVSKAAAELLGYQYFQNFGMEIYLPRLFAQLGTGHPPNNAVQAFGKQLGEIYHKIQPPVIRTGNLDSSRDFLDIRDGIAAMELLLEKGTPGEPANICSGKPVLISELLEELVKVSGLKVSHEIDTAKIRPADEPVVYGDNQKIKALGWKPKYKLGQSLKLIFEDWKQRTIPKQS